MFFVKENERAWLFFASYLGGLAIVLYLIFMCLTGAMTRILFMDSVLHKLFLSKKQDVQGDINFNRQSTRKFQTTNTSHNMTNSKRDRLSSFFGYQDGYSSKKIRFSSRQEYEHYVKLKEQISEKKVTR